MNYNRLMKWPIVLPKHLAYLLELEAPELILSTLLAHTTADVVDFYEYASEDETWTQQNGQAMGAIFAWLEKEFLNGRLKGDFPRRVVQATQPHYYVIKPNIQDDIWFVMKGGEKIGGNSFILSMSGEFFEGIILREKQRVVELRDIEAKLFSSVIEFVCSGTIVNLWREEPAFVLELIRLAQKIGLLNLASFAVLTYKNYIDKGNVHNTLLLAQNEHLTELKAICLSIIASFYKGLRFEFTNPEEIRVTLSALTEEETAVLEALAPYITFMKLEKSVAHDEGVYKILKSCSKIRGLDLSYSYENPLNLFPDNLRDISFLDLSACDWLDDEAFRQVAQFFPKVEQLVMKEMLKVTFGGFGELIHWKRLEVLDLAECGRLTDAEVEVIGVSSPGLRELSLDGCFHVSGNALLSMMSSLTRLSSLNIARLPLISALEFGELAVLCNGLEEINVSSCPGFTGEALEAFGDCCSYLKQIQLEGTAVTDDELDRFQHDHPQIQIYTRMN